MALKASTALRNYMLTDGPLKSILEPFSVRIYGDDGTEPASADDAVSGTLLVEMNDLYFDSVATDGTLTKDTTPWTATVLETGTAKYFRIVNTSVDSGSLSTTEARLQGTCGPSGKDMNMTSTLLTLGVAHVIDAANITLPTY